MNLNSLSTMISSPAVAFPVMLSLASFFVFIVWCIEESEKPSLATELRRNVGVPQVQTPGPSEAPETKAPTSTQEAPQVSQLTRPTLVIEQMIAPKQETQEQAKLMTTPQNPEESIPRIPLRHSDSLPRLTSLVKKTEEMEKNPPLLCQRQAEPNKAVEDIKPTPNQLTPSQPILLIEGDTTSGKNSEEVEQRSNTFGGIPLTGKGFVVN
ncbi:hypothetical protein BLNAU_17888 [Blattamonas nauphoetae]|uniref:Uncharacterized protein n=1 Tax=Blattamonas nauphoetae TaxID=2049346 RepID=A0ABQ9X5X5_9EUKA|nr:hypothetical protein BLNAU_17888 [Blattamonas nauphoetae]